jgi:hypothetical protein
MKRWLTIGNLFLVVASLSVLPGCFKDRISRTYTLMKPVYASKATVLNNIRSNNPRSLEAPGKIYILGRYLFVNEIDKGVHIIDNSDPSNPRAVAFVDIPGNIDIAVRGSYLYADMYKELVVVDISDPLNAKLVKEVPNVFSDRYYGTLVNDSAYVIVDWEIKDTMVDVEDAAPQWFGEYIAFAADGASQSKANYVPGIAGSLARFSIVNDYLYAINTSSLHSFNVSQPDEPVRTDSIYVGWNIETLYPFKDKLLIGSTTGMFIYDIQNPAKPQPVSTFDHARACDPVVTDGDYAFITLRTGNTCNGISNQLDIVDIKNVESPTLARTYPLTNPAGLAKDGNTLFICDGSDGLKIFDAENVHNLRLIRTLPDAEPKDVIAWAGNLVMVAKEGIYQYDYSSLPDLVQRSFIPVKIK